MEPKEMLDVALDILTEKNKQAGNKETFARHLALSAMYGMLSNDVTKKQAKLVLEIAKEW